MSYYGEEAFEDTYIELPFKPISDAALEIFIEEILNDKEPLFWWGDDFFLGELFEKDE